MSDIQYIYYNAWVSTVDMLNKRKEISFKDDTNEKYNDIYFDDDDKPTYELSVNAISFANMYQNIINDKTKYSPTNITELDIHAYNNILKVPVFVKFLTHKLMISSKKDKNQQQTLSEDLYAQIAKLDSMKNENLTNKKGTLEDIMKTKKIQIIIIYNIDSDIDLHNNTFKTLEKLYYPYLEYFEVRELGAQILDHIDQPEFELLRPSQDADKIKITRVLNDFHCTKSKLRSRRSNDIISRYYGAMPGDIFYSNGEYEHVI
jgi:hypothetical protein